MSLHTIIKNQSSLTAIIETEKNHLPIKISYPERGVWRLQTDISGIFEKHGAGQQLALDLGETPYEPTLPFEMQQNIDSDVTLLGDDNFSLNFSQQANCINAFCKGNCRLPMLKLFTKGEETTITAELTENEYLWGTGERFNTVNQRGKLIDMMAIDQWCHTEGNSYLPIPLLISNQGYAIFINSFSHSVMNLGHSNQNLLQIHVDNSVLDVYVITFDHPSEVLAVYHRITGSAPMPADWLFGIHVCRHEQLAEFGTPERIFAMVDKMEENDFPWDSIILEGWHLFDVERDDILKKVVDKLHGLGKKACMYEICARAPIYHTDEEAEFWKKAIDLKEEYFVKNAKTQETLLPDTTFYNPADAPEKRQSRYLDITNPAAVSWWFRDVWGRVKETMGIDGCKIDFCEQFPEHIPLSFYDGRDTNGAHHWYPVLYNSLMYRYYQSNHLDGGMCFSRGGGIGAQRYPLLWLGDQLREWKFMSAILTGALSCGLSGIPFVSWDLAAYLPSNDPQNNNEADIFQRGLEVACFSTSMQTHGKVTRPYDFAEPVKDVYRKYSKIHQILRPYLKEQAEKSCQSGMPLMRHLLLHDFSDPVNYTIEDEYLLGEALLIAPVLNNQNKRDIYLPQGKWTSLDTGEEYDGKQWLSSVSVPIDEIPIFIKQGHSSLVLDNIVAKIRKLTKGI